MIDSVEVVVITLVALLPGFVSLIGFGGVVPRANREGSELLLACLGFGVINASLHVWWLAPALLSDAETLADFVKAHPFLSALAAVIYCLVTPVVIGYLAGLARNYLRLPGMLDPTPTAWDRFFKDRPGCIVYATFENGQRVAGLYNTETGGFAAAFPHPQTIYCGKMFPLDDKGRITGPPLQLEGGD